MKSDRDCLDKLWDGQRDHLRITTLSLIDGVMRASYVNVNSDEKLLLIQNILDHTERLLNPT